MLERYEGFKFVLETLANLLELSCLNYLDKKVMDLNQDLVHSKRTNLSDMIGERNKVCAEKSQDVAIHHGNFDPTQSLVEYGVKYGSDKKCIPTSVHGRDQISECPEGTKSTRCLRMIKTTHELLGLCHTCYCQHTQPITEKVMQNCSK